MAQVQRKTLVAGHSWRKKDTSVRPVEIISATSSGKNSKTSPKFIKTLNLVQAQKYSARGLGSKKKLLPLARG